MYAIQSKFNQRNSRIDRVIQMVASQFQMTRRHQRLVSNRCTDHSKQVGERIYCYAVREKSGYLWETVSTRVATNNDHNRWR